MCKVVKNVSVSEVAGRNVPFAEGDKRKGISFNATLELHEWGYDGRCAVCNTHTGGRIEIEIGGECGDVSLYGCVVCGDWSLDA